MEAESQESFTEKLALTEVTVDLREKQEMMAKLKVSNQCAV